MKNICNYLVGLVLLASMLVSVAPPAAAYPQAGVDEMLTSAELSSRTTGGPDAFGYTWDDGVAINWIDATGGTNLGLSSSFSVTSAVPIGFNFPYFENFYDEVYVTPAGWLTFEPLPSGFNDYWSKRLLNPTAPNNLIAPYWETLSMGEGAVYALQGEGYFVVEWHNVYHGGNQTFQVILHDNGDIVMQYSSMVINVSYPGVVGIEDSRGIGLEYPDTAAIVSGTAIRFTPPAEPARRALFTPFTHSAFTNPGQNDFEFTVHNPGTLGDDSYVLTPVTPDENWGFELYQVDGETELESPLTLTQGESRAIIGRATVPSGTQIGDYNEITLTVTSSNDLSVTNTAVIAFLTPAPFAQIFGDGADNAFSNYLVTPEGQEKILLPQAVYGDERSIIELPNFSLLSVWNEWDSLQNSAGNWFTGYLLYYSIIDRSGNTVVSKALLSDIESVESGLNGTNDNKHFLAVAPNGNVGIIWYRHKQISSTYNVNIHFAMIDMEGNIVVEDTNITQQEIYYIQNSNEHISFDDPQIAATENGDFFLAWRTETWQDSGPSRKVHYTIAEPSGSFSEITEVTDNTKNISGLVNLGLTALTGDRIFVTWYQIYYEPEWGTYTAYKVFDGTGDTIVEETDLGITVAYDPQQQLPDLAQISDGTIIMVSWGYSAPVKFILFDDITYEPFHEHAFDLLPGFTYAQYPSVTTDMEGHAIITWRSYSAEKGMDQLIYALISSDGTIVSGPFPFYSPSKYSSNKYFLRTSNNRQGNTTYHKNTPPFFTSTPDTTSVFQDALYTYGITADDYDLDIGDNLTITSADDLPAWLSLVAGVEEGTATLSGIPGNADVGEHPITLVVTDSTNKSKTQAFTITVININDPPYFISYPTITTVDEGELYEYIITTEDPDWLHGDDLLTITAPTLPTLPTWLELTDNGDGTARLFGTPQNADIGDHDVELLVTDSNEGFDSQSFTITVAAYFEAPRFTSEATTVILTVGDYAEVTITATGQPLPTITLDAPVGVDVLPAGMNFYGGIGSATISGTPAQETGGIYELVFVASNDVLPDATQEFTLIVATEVVVDGTEEEISSSSGDILITIPEGAVSGEATFTLVPQMEPSQDTGSFSFAGTSFTLTAEDSLGTQIDEFDPPLIITITYDPEALGEIDPMTLMLYKWDGAAWVDAICDGEDYDRGEGWFSLPICHLSEFAVLGEAGTGYQIFLPLILR